MKTLHKLVILPSLDTERIRAIEAAHELEEQFGNVRIKVTFRVIPDFLDGVRLEADNDIDETWIQEKLNDLRYHIVNVDMTDEMWEKYGLRDTLYGQARVVTTGFGKQAITYGRWDNNTGDSHAEQMPEWLQPIETLTVGTWHEDCHAVAGLTGGTDRTHLFFYGMENDERWVNTPAPELAWSTLPFEHLQPLKTRLQLQLANVMTMLATLYGKLLGMKQNQLLHPVEKYKNYVSQAYGVANDAYPLSGHHIGCDYATPEGTPVRAPFNGRVVVSGHSKVLGNFCHFQYEFNGQRYTERYLHLHSAPAKKEYGRGEVIARTGDTGMSTNPHLHIDIWLDDVDLTIINQSNWSELTRDPQTHY